MKKNLILIEENINQEIAFYRELEALYQEKQEILVNKKIDELVEIDSKIMKTFASIRSLIINRNKIFLNISESSFSMSKLIEDSRIIDSVLSKKFEKQKEEVNELVKSLSQLDFINMELTKFGMKLANKTMQIILNNVKIPTNEYNNQGKVINQDKLELSSVSEEV